MKVGTRTRLQLPLLIALPLLAAGSGGWAASRGAAPHATRLATARLKIGGMHCPSCSAGLVRRLSKVRGVRGVEIDAARGLGTVRYQPAVCRPAELVSAVKKGGFSASVLR